MKRYTEQGIPSIAVWYKRRDILSISIIEPASVLQLCARHHPAYTLISSCHALKCVWEETLRYVTRHLLLYPNNGNKKLSIINCQLNASPSKNMFHLPRRPIQFRRHNKSQSRIIQQSCKLRFNFGRIKVTCKETFFFIFI